MLCELSVKNLGIIEDINWQLSEGLNIITGETGAGKSLIIDAIELLLSGKADTDSIRYGANEAQIEAVFELSSDRSLASLRELLVQKDLAIENNTLLISCRQRRKGAGIIRVNGQTVSRTVLQQIGKLLVDIHGQSEHLSLLDTRSHLLFVDAYAGTQDLKSAFQKKASEIADIEKELQMLVQKEKDITRQQGFLKFQLEEIDRAKLHDGEEEELQQERNILYSVEKLKELSYEVYQAIYGDDTTRQTVPALNKLHDASRSLQKLTELDATLNEQLKFLEEYIAGLTEMARDIHAYNERLHYDGNRLEEIENRLELIRTLKRKYGQTIAEILGYRTKIENDLNDIENLTTKKEQLEKTLTNLRQEAGQIACRLSQERTAGARRLETAVKKELNDLNMSQVEFGIAVKQRPDTGGMPLPDGTAWAFDDTGIDVIEFMAATNPGEPVKPLARIASTGELARFTLAIKGALAAADNIPLLIFDEIDIGIGGRSGETIGQKLWLLGRTHQVVCVTHLPQIAAFADTQFGVRKQTTDGRTSSTIIKLDDDTRRQELAGMLAGEKYSGSALTGAGELIQRADKWKEGL